MKAPFPASKVRVCDATFRPQSADGHDMNATCRIPSAGSVAET
ncbi:hypothetical protein ACL00T_01805 [Curtobacterium flaccumfaciens]